MIVPNVGKFAVAAVDLNGLDPVSISNGFDMATQAADMVTAPTQTLGAKPEVHAF